MQCTHNHILNVWRQKETSETIIGRDFAFADKRHVNNKNAIYNFQHAVAISFFHSSTSKNNAHLPLIIFNELITIYFGNLQICQDTLFIYSDCYWYYNTNYVRFYQEFPRSKISFYSVYNKSSIVGRYLHGFLNFANVELETRSSFQYNNSNTKQWYCILAPYKKNMECVWCHGFRGIWY